MSSYLLTVHSLALCRTLGQPVSPLSSTALSHGLQVVTNRLYALGTNFQYVSDFDEFFFLVFFIKKFYHLLRHSRFLTLFNPAVSEWKEILAFNLLTQLSLTFPQGPRLHVKASRSTDGSLATLVITRDILEVFFRVSRRKCFTLLYQA
ncbi:hypothetical protein RRG08_004352 [Elysia crispata]|uniref:Maturase K n=1 Tax=Elysia crispata TaxID=231223 RepID=A0AAE0Z727_9GAST|nr:hypothetical protein RRG08_004352 [Elysia crispata]